MAIDFSKELNEQQAVAVTAEPGPILVIAGAGSGKTRTLTYRVAWLLENGVAPDRCLLLTFTNKAAKEMLGRVGNLVPHDATRIWGGTFHSVANRLLRRHAKLISYEPSYGILDREDSKDLINACIPDAGVDIRERRFPKGDLLVEIFSLAVNTLRSAAQIVERQFSHFAGEIEAIQRIQKMYGERKKQANAMDYDDLLSNCHRLLGGHPEIADVYGRQFQAILVDEYQDTNKIQSDLVDLLAAKHQNLMVVGDDAQCIYGWRGANFQNIMEFPKRYPKARVFKIEFNYRSTPQILGLANKSIESNACQFEKVLQATRKNGLKPRLVRSLNASDQANFVAEQMLELRDQGVPLHEMAVLYRSHFHSMELQMELTRRNVPFVITSGLRFFEQAHIKDVAAYLKLAINPGDELAFKRTVLRMPKIGNATAGKLWEKLKMLHAPCSTPGNPPNYFALLDNVPKPAQKEWKQFVETLKQLREEKVIHKPGTMIKMVLDAGYHEYLQSKFENAVSRKEDIEQLALYAGRFNKTEDFLADLALMTNVENDNGRLEENHDREMTRLSTVHQAKGQEFTAVFVIWLADGAFPNSRALDGAEGEEEERRLFYVAITRAKDELYLVYPQLRVSGGYGEAFQQPSRFLEEIPSKFYDRAEV